jgi:hypothetical protein
MFSVPAPEKTIFCGSGTVADTELKIMLPATERVPDETVI